MKGVPRFDEDLGQAKEEGASPKIISGVVWGCFSCMGSVHERYVPWTRKLLLLLFLPLRKPRARTVTEWGDDVELLAAVLQESCQSHLRYLFPPACFVFYSTSPNRVLSVTAQRKKKKK